MDSCGEIISSDDTASFFTSTVMGLIFGDGTTKPLEFTGDAKELGVDDGSFLMQDGESNEPELVEVVNSGGLVSKIGVLVLQVGADVVHSCLITIGEEVMVEKGLPKDVVEGVLLARVGLIAGDCDIGVVLGDAAGGVTVGFCSSIEADDSLL